MSDAPTPPADADTADAPEQAPDATPEPTAATADDLAKWKALARKHEANAKANAAAARRLAEIEDANKSEAERLSARAEAAERERDEARAAMTRAVAESVVTAAAAGRLADPRDALALLDLSSLAGDDGAVDAKALAGALDALVAAKPYLSAARQPAPPAAAGVGATGTPPAGLDDQIAAAQAAGDWKAVVRLNNIKLSGAKRAEGT